MTAGVLGLLFSVGLLIWLALRGIDIIFAALLCAVVVIIANDLPFADTLQNAFALGKLGAFTFAGKFFILFASGAMFGKCMGDSGAAASMASSMTRVLGPDRALIITVLATALLTYGGVVVFVVVFATYPLGLQLLKEADIPKRLFAAALALGAGTFTLTALPGTPSIHNVISASALGTDLFAGPLLGLLSAGIMMGLGLWYLEFERKRAKAIGEGFVPGPKDQGFMIDAGELPSWPTSILPLAVVLGTILAPRLLPAEGDWIGAQVVSFAQSQPIVWPSFALVLGSLICVGLFPRIRHRGLATMGQGTQDAIMPLISTAAVIGFGGVVTQTQSFQQFAGLVVESGLPTLLSVFSSVSLISAITGSASGGLQIFMQTLAPAYLAQGVDPEVLHRIATVASGGFDSLPHCGAVVAMLTITQLTQKEAYKDVGVISVVIPVIAVLITIFAATMGVK